jgi:hypothetical protein
MIPVLMGLLKALKLSPKMKFISSFIHNLFIFVCYRFPRNRWFSPQGRAGRILPMFKYHFEYSKKLQFSNLARQINSKNPLSID